MRLRGRVGRPGFVLVLAAASAGGCGSTRPVVRAETGLKDPQIVRRMEALREVDRTKDRSLTPEVIELLDDEDPGVRLMAGAVLKDLTGHESGYEAHAGPVQREQQVRAWRAWWEREGRPVAQAPAPGTVR
jgi:hypothetical protein